MATQLSADEDTSPDRPNPAGRPRLVVVPAGGHAIADGPEALGYEVEFALEPRRMTIGSDSEQDIVLEGLAPAHAAVDWWADGDEFVFEPMPTGDTTATVDGAATTIGLHHGDRIQLGEWTLVFQRDEEADHVRRGRAREGGDYAGGGVTEAGGHATESE
ncbi:MAG TPA: FHA domain-containing protein [Mycobacteriales bacterium]|jgi:hypothetical protein|nr:FHA domain-containing protein [Mycobacteriales bacterium]